jgi:hypothetical protein
MKNNKNIAIVGSRSFSNFDLLNEVMSEIIEKEGNFSNVVSGGAKGCDTLANDWAISNGVNIIVFLPKYENFPSKKKWMAPKERNTLIVENSDIVLAFWDMKSTGTKDTIDKSVEINKKVYLYDITEKKLVLYNDKVN